MGAPRLDGKVDQQRLDFLVRERERLPVAGDLRRAKQLKREPRHGRQLG